MDQVAETCVLSLVDFLKALAAFTKKNAKMPLTTLEFHWKNVGAGLLMKGQHDDF